MIAALIVAGVVTYAIIGGVVGGCVHRALSSGKPYQYNSDECPACVIVGVFWPLALPALLGIKLGSIVSKGLKE